MIKIILAFVIVFGLFFIGIRAVRALNGQDQWALTKILSYSALCATLTTMFLTVLVVIF